MAKTRLQIFDSSLIACIIHHRLQVLFPFSFLNPSNLELSIIPIMLRSQLIRQLRAASQTPLQRSPLQRSTFSSLSPISSRAPIAFSSRIPRRWQSTEAETKSQASESAAEAKPAEAQRPEDSLKQDIAKKDKEVLDLKVRHSMVYTRSIASNMSYRINTCALWRTIAIFKIA